MANTVASLNPENWKSDVQDFLNSILVVKGIANMQFRAELVDGDTINWPTITDQRVQAYTPGTDLTIDDFVSAQSTMTINQSRASTVSIDVTEVRQAKDKAYPVKLARQAAFVIGQELDQNALNHAIDTASNTTAGGTLTASTIYSTLADVMAQLQRSNAADGPMFAVLDPERVSLLAQSEVANGFNLADSALKNGFVGNSQAGFKIYNSNNLPTSVGATIDTQPTNGDTFTIAGVTFTCVTDGTASSAGEVAIGANLADFQTIFPQAVNGTGTPGASNYIAVSVANRRILQNAQVTAGAFDTNVSTITAYGAQNNTETFTAATNVFGTETGSLLCGRMGALSVGMQMQPNLFIRPEPKQLSDNYITHTLYGRQVFSRDAARLTNLTINV